MRVITFNANGIRAAERNGFYHWLATQEADFVCIQETKSQVTQLLPKARYFPVGYYCDYYDAQKKGYSGVAIFARHKPLNIQKGFGYHHCDEEGRYIQFDYPNLSIISLYLPSGTTGDVRQTVKFEFLNRFTEQLLLLKQSKRELIICGDYNIAHKEIDLKNWKANQKNSGFLPEERQWIDYLLDSLEFADAFRIVNPHPEEYSWWTYRRNARQNNVGWRIDYQLITKGLFAKVEQAAIFRDQVFSDHAPVIIDYRGALYA